MVLDFIYILAFLGSIASGYIKGFSRMLISLISVFLSIFLVLTIFSWAGDAILSSGFGSELKQDISEEINRHFDEKLIEDIPYFASLAKFSSDKQGTVDMTALSDKIAEKSVKAISSILLIFICYVISKIIIWLLRKVVKTFSSLPIVGLIDSLLGAVSGLLFGIVAIGCIFIGVMFLQFVPAMDTIRHQYDSSVICLLINDLFF